MKRQYVAAAAPKGIQNKTLQTSSLTSLPPVKWFIKKKNKSRTIKTTISVPMNSVML